jgi:hypothetical protein
MPVNRVSFCTHADSVDREIFFIVESEKTGELKLFFRRAIYSNFNNKEGTPPGKLISDQRYSIHTSPNSANDINTVKYTYRVGEHLKNGYLYTKAVKAKQGFAPIFSRSCPDLSKPHYRPKQSKNAKTISLGSYDPRFFLFIYSVFVAHPDLEFNWYVPEDFCYAQHRFTRFRIIVVWSFLTVPSTPRGEWLHMESALKPDASPSFIDGLSEFYCIKLHKSHRDYLKYHWLCQIDDANIRGQGAMVGQFFRYGSQNTPEYREWSNRASIAYLFPIRPWSFDEKDMPASDGYRPAVDITKI